MMVKQEKIMYEQAGGEEETKLRIKKSAKQRCASHKCEYVCVCSNDIASSKSISQCIRNWNRQVSHMCVYSMCVSSDFGDAITALYRWTSLLVFVHSFVRLNRTSVQRNEVRIFCMCVVSVLLLWCEVICLCYFLARMFRFFLLF